MATGMRLWTLLAVGATAIVAAFALPLEPRTYPSRPDPAPAVEARNDVLREITGLNVRLKRLRWVDSLVAELAAARDAGAPFAFGYPDAVEGDAAAWAGELLAEAVRRESSRAARDPADPVPYFGTYVVPLDLGSHPELRTDHREVSGREWYAARLPDGTPFCLQVVASRGMHPEGAFTAHLTGTPAGTLGVCRLWLRYGAPGARVAAWLSAGGSTFGATASLTPEQRRMRDERLRFAGRAGDLFGGVSAWGVSTHQRRCLAGVDGACADLLFEPEVMSQARAGGSRIGPGAAAGATPLIGSDFENEAYDAVHIWNHRGQVLADLAADFGREAFGAFWRSESAPEEAFRKAFGVTADAWYRGHLRSVYGRPARPRPSAAGLGMVALALLGSMAVAVRASRRREAA